MSAVQVQNLTRRFGAQAAAFEVTFDVPAGEAAVLLGPVQCGKTTVLRCLAGVETPDSGIIAIDGEPVFDSVRGIDVPPERRGLGVVFRSDAVWPHMTVGDNVAFPLKVRGVAEAERRGRARAMLEQVGLAGLEDRSAHQISDGQRRRVALARALVHGPRLVLFDGALTHLDNAERDRMRIELRDLRERLGFTALFATYDHTEAFGLADRIILMNNGAIETIGPARETFRAPSTAFAARFFGMNVLEGLLVRAVPGGDLLEVELTERLIVRGRAAPDAELTMGGRVLACIHRDAVRLLRPARPEAAAGVIAAVSFRGEYEEYVVDVAGVRFHAICAAAAFARGDRVDVTMTPADWVFVR
jgi:ABC-type Fe3+/spermidine/putrescine transport system ATPase subunit